MKKNRLLFECNSEAKHFYIVRTGQILLFHLSQDGKEKVVDILEPGQTFSESILFTEDKYNTINARANLDTVVFYFDSQIFKKQLRQSSDLCLTMMTEMSHRLKSQTQEIIELSVYDAQYRLVIYLLMYVVKQSWINCYQI